MQVFFSSFSGFLRFWWKITKTPENGGFKPFLRNFCQSFRFRNRRNIYFCFKQSQLFSALCPHPVLAR